MNLARLNHILIPATAEGRDRIRMGRFAFLGAPLGWLYGALSEEGRALFVLLLFVGAASVDVARTQSHVLWAALVGVLAAATLARRWFGLTGVHMTVRSPSRVTAGQETTLELVFENRGSEPQQSIRIQRPFLPWDGAWRGPALALRDLPPGAVARVGAPVRFVARGPHHLDVFHAAGLVPLGLTLGPSIASGQSRFVVWPRPARLGSLERLDGGGSLPTGRRRLTAIDVSEPSGVRPYRSGDPIRDLHARTWARTGVPHVRERRPESRARRAVVFAPEPAAEDVFEAAISLAAALVLRLAEGQAEVELLISSNVPVRVSVGRGSGSVHRALDALAHVVPERTLDHDRAAAWLAARCRGIGALWLVSPAEHARWPAFVAEARQRGLPSRLVSVALSKESVKAQDTTIVARDVLADRRIDL